MIFSMDISSFTDHWELIELSLSSGPGRVSADTFRNRVCVLIKLIKSGASGFVVKNRLVQCVNPHVKLAIVKIYNTEPSDPVPQDAVS